MSKKSMVCGIDCNPGDANCNNYCNHDKSRPMADSAPDATEEIVMSQAKENACQALHDAYVAWFEYSDLQVPGEKRNHAFDVLVKLREVRGEMARC